MPKVFNNGILILILLNCFVYFTRCSSSQIIEVKSAGMNGGFEYIENGLPVNWYFDNLKDAVNKEKDAVNDVDIISDSIDFKEGKRSLKFIVKKCSPKGFTFSPGIFKEFEADAGADYKVSFWVKNNGTSFRISISAITVEGGSKEPNEVKIISSKDAISEWKEYVVERHIPKDLDRLRFGLEIIEPGTFQIDDIRIEKVK